MYHTPYVDPWLILLNHDVSYFSSQKTELFFLLTHSMEMEMDTEAIVLAGVTILLSTDDKG
jgi:hypothetical protein